MRKFLLFLIVISGNLVLRAQDTPNVPVLAGTYSGKAPCADCKVIETELELKYDTDSSGEFSLRDKYIGKGGVDMASRIKGEWLRVVDAKAGTLIVLNRDQTDKVMYYSLGKDGSLLPLDENMQKIESPIDCTLRKK